jgi:hypothetical protein
MITKGAMTPGRTPARRPTRGALAVGLALSVASSGCSFAIMRPPPRHEDWPNPVLPDSSEAKCTASLGPPVVDSLAFGLTGTLAYVERNAITYVNQSNVDAMGNVLATGRRGLSHFDPPRIIAVPTPDYLARGIALSFGIGALIAAASAVYGFIENSRCTSYKALFHPPLE